MKNKKQDKKALIVERAFTREDGKTSINLKEEKVNTITTRNSAKTLIQPTKTKEEYIIRRLTPIESERLMGWEDDWTLYDKHGNIIADTNRYKMVGNGIVSPVAQMICENLIKIHNKNKRKDRKIKNEK